MTSRKKEIDNPENPFSLSIGDLMAALMFIFILLLSATLLQVQEKAEADQKISDNYNKIKQQLYIDLEKEFKDDLKVWNAVIDSSELSVRFQEPSTLFDLDRAILKTKFQEILKDFFPRYIRLINLPQYKDNIEEIRIEGHTDSSGEYFHNMQLSQDRTRTVLQYCLNLIDEELKKWAILKITANGLSSSHIITDKNGKEDRELSRRVEFRIRTNAEKQLEKIAMRNSL